MKKTMLVLVSLVSSVSAFAGESGWLESTDVSYPVEGVYRNVSIERVSTPSGWVDFHYETPGGTKLGRARMYNGDSDSTHVSNPDVTYERSGTMNADMPSRIEQFLISAFSRNVGVDLRLVSPRYRRDKDAAQIVSVTLTREKNAQHDGRR